MPPITITLSEAEALHIQKLLRNHKDDLYEWAHSYVLPDWMNSHKAVLAMDEALLEKFNG